MSTISETPAAAPPAVADGADAGPPTPMPTILRGVRYRTYVAIRNAPANRHVRMTYYDGTLELMSPAYVHEEPSFRFGLLISIVCMELKVEFQAAGSTTFRKAGDGKKKGKGKEPDQSFYFANAAKTLGKENLRLEIDPPPDLWIEVDNRSGTKGKLPLYAALGVPEVWRYRVETQRLWFGRLLADGSGYEEIGRSLSLPMLTPALVLEALALGDGVLMGTWMQALQAWVREKLAGNGGAAR